MFPLTVSSPCIVSAVGAGQAATLSALRGGRSGLGPCRFPSADLPTWVGEIAALDDLRLDQGLAEFDCRNNRLAELALRQDGFLAAAGAAVARYGRDRIGLFLGTSTSGIQQAELAYRACDPRTGELPAWFDYGRTQNTWSLARYLHARLGITGPSLVVSCACASTAKAFANAARMIATGRCDAAIVGGADSLCLTTLYGFQSLQLNAEGPCRPFDAARSGISIGEAAGFVLVEKPGATSDVDAPAISLLGIGESNDAHHMSSPHPEGIGARLAMQRALASAGLRADEIDYINLHGTATRAGDAAEDRAVFELFGDRTCVGSTKGQTGHTLGAAGIIEAIIAWLAIRHGLRPGNPNTERVDPSLKCRYAITPAAVPIERVMSNSFGFGGNNCSLIFGRAR